MAFTDYFQWRRVTPVLSWVLLVAGLCVGSGVASAQDMPAIPDPVPVELDASTTAYLLLDLNVTVCAARVTCVESLPAATRLLERARAAGVFVVYSTARGAALREEAARHENDPLVDTFADKFFQTDLDEILLSRGIKTVVIVGTAANGAPLYTAFQANMRGLTVVVAEDAITEDNPFAVFVARWQLLNHPGYTNPDNTPLADGRVTLSRTDLITFN